MVGMPSSAMRVIADQDSLRLFYLVAEKKRIESANLKKLGRLSNKEYYSRTRRMIEIGLVKRVEGVFTITAFGVVVYHSCLRIEAAIKHYFKLKAIDAIQEKGMIGNEECARLVRLLIDNDTIREILSKTDTDSVTNKNAHQIS